MIKNQDCHMFESTGQVEGGSAPDRNSLPVRVKIGFRFISFNKTLIKIYKNFRSR
jgi:hypothetical protein